MSHTKSVSNIEAPLSAIKLSESVKIDKVITMTVNPKR